MEKKQRKKHGLIWFFAVVAVIAVAVMSTLTTIQSHLNLGLDLQGGFEILYQIDPLNEGADVNIPAVVNSIQKRVNVLGVNEPTLTIEGDNRIRVQLAGIADQTSARELLGTTANLTFRDINDEELSDASIVQEGGASLAFQDGRPIVSLKIADTNKFADITTKISQRPVGQNMMVIWLDWENGDTYVAEANKSVNGSEPKYISAASVTSTINGDCVIQGNFTEAEARTLANLINSGSLPVKLSEISSNVVSAEYGEGALKTTATAGIVGIIAVMLFMIYKYRLSGMIASIMLVAYIWAIFAIYALMGATFTLPGIGALVLGVGMTVDANIITYERIHQQLYKGRSIPYAVSDGQKLSFSSIFDSQFTTLLAGLIMYWFGNGAVKGFATMLIITVVMTLIVNVALSRYLLNLVVDTGKVDCRPDLFGVKKENIPDVNRGEKQFYSVFKYMDILGVAKYWIRTSIIIIAVSLLLVIVNAVKGNGIMNFGIDFASGTKLTITSQSPITISEVSSELSTLGYHSFEYQASGDTTVYATIKDSLTPEQLSKIKNVFVQKYGEEPGDNVVTPIVGRELVRNAIILTIVAWIAMLAYIAVRYEWDYAVSCLIALIHDVFIVLSLFAILRLEVNTELISVLLTIIGYSINNSIVVFDRVRETVRNNEKSGAKKHYKDIVNEALNNTFGMSVYSSVTTLLTIVFLLVLGSKAIFTFTFAMFIGMLSGTFSSLFIAPAVWYWIRSKYHPTSFKKIKKEPKEKLDEYVIKGINA